MKGSPYRKLFELIPDLLDEEMGIINQVFSLPREANMPDFMYYKALLANTGLYDGPENFSVAGGTSLSRERALAKAIGEAVERYSSGVYFWDDLPFGTYNDFSNAISPDRFIPFHKTAFESAKFELTEFTKTTRLHWSKASSLNSDQEVFVPAALVFCPYGPDKFRGEVEIAESMSTGLAAHMSLPEASLNGILEVVERDSFMLFWLSGRSPQKIDKSSLTSIHLEMIRRFNHAGYDLSLYNITSDNGIPTILATMEGKFKAKVPFSVSAACHLNPIDAITKCLEECALMERYAKRVMINASEWQPFTETSKIHYLIDHIRYWLDPNNYDKKHFISQNGETISLGDLHDLSTNNVTDDLAKVVLRIAESGHETLICDVTSPDIESLGMRVIRAIIPGYLPLNKRYACRPVESKRLAKHLYKFGGQAKINPLPHPFA